MPVENSSDVNTFYLPHRAVIREGKSTMKVRIVFDASAHAKTEISQNDYLYTGLNFIHELFSLLIRFRNFPVAITADVQKTFLHMEIDEPDRDFTRFLGMMSHGLMIQVRSLNYSELEEYFSM